MQYRRAFIILGTAILIALQATRVPAQTTAPAQTTPSAEPAQPVARLQNFGTLVSFLNLASGAVRVVAILKPSDPSSEAMIGALQSILSGNASPRLRAYVVWTRLGPEDTELRAAAACSRVRDRRLVYFWDSEAFVANAFRGAVVSKDTPATGVLLLYDTDARLSIDPPAPTLWMSANPDIPGDALDAKRLGEGVNAMVHRVEEKVSDGAGAGKK